MQKVNVLHIRDSCGLYGAERVILVTAKYLDKEKYNFEMIVFRRKNVDIGAFIDAIQKIGVKVIELPVRGRIDLRSILKLRKILKKRNIDIIHSHDFKSNFYSILATLNMSIHKVVTSHGSTRDSPLKKIYLFLDERVFYNFFDIIIAVSEEIKLFLLGKIVKLKKIVVIQNGIDVSSIESNTGEISTVFAAQPDKKQIIFGLIARLFRDKGHKYFIEAFRMVHRNHPETRAIFVGDGPLKDELTSLIKQFGLENAIRLLGVRNDMDKIYRQIDYVVIPSLREGLPYTLLEAMSQKIPVLATTVGDIPKLVSHGKTGYLVAPADINALTANLNKLVEDPETAKAMTKKAYRNIMENYSAEIMVRNIEKIYESLL